MALATILNDLDAAFKAFAADTRVLLLHPTSRYRTALVSRLLNDSALPVFYFAMASDDTDIPSFIAGFTHDMAEQVPTFGIEISRADIHSLQDLTPLLEAFNHDLNELSADPFILLLDEFDCAEIGDDLEMLFEQLVDFLPPQCRLVISSRNVPRFPWMSLIAQRKAVMLRDDEQISRDFYHQQGDADAQIRVLALGPGTVEFEGKLVSEWEGHLPRLLLFFALDRPIVTRSEICQAFWPELSTDQAVNVFHVTKRRLHKALESGGLDILVHEDGSYRINPALNIHYDIAEFVSALVDARAATTDNRVALWQHVIDLYPRPFLQGHTEPWIVRRRQEYQAGYLEGLAEMATIRLDEGRPEQALGLLQLAIKENNRRQDIHRRIMSLFSDLGRRSEAASHYQRLQETLQDQDIPLEAETQALYKQLMS